MQGIYAIVNTVSGRRYVGSSTDLSRRWNEHVSELNRSRHLNKQLQRSWNKHGAQAFAFVLLEEVFDPQRLIEREQAHIEATAEAYNTCVAGRPPAHKGRRWTGQALANIQAAARSDEKRARMRETHLGKTRGPHSDETRQKISAAQKGIKRKPLSADHRAKVSASRKGHEVSADTRARISAALTGRKLSAAHRANLRATWTPRGCAVH